MDERRSDSIQWVLEVAPGSSPISGRVSDAAGRVRRFSSWVGLLAALKALQDESAAVSDPR